MNTYTADVEISLDGPATAYTIDDIMDALDEYAPAVGTTPRGHATIRITYPATTLAQAATTAIGAVTAATGRPVIRLDVMSEAEADLRVGSVDVPELVGVTDAADMLGVSVQRVRQMIGEGKLAAHRIGERSYALVRSEVTAKAA